MLGARRELLSGLYAITSHFEAAVDVIVDEDERHEVARLFYVVGMGALHSAAFDVARRYLLLAAALADLSHDRPAAAREHACAVPWWTLWLSLARCMAALQHDELQRTLDALATGARDAVEVCCTPQDTLAQSPNTLTHNAAQFADYSQMRILQLERTGRMPEAIDLSFEMLKRLGLDKHLLQRPPPDQADAIKEDAIARLLSIIPSTRKAILALALLVCWIRYHCCCCSMVCIKNFLVFYSLNVTMNTS
jgi:hypothetical protein